MDEYHLEHHRELLSGKVAILLYGGLKDLHGKTGLTMLRYFSGEIVAVVDRVHAGSSICDVTDIERPTPVVASVREAISLGATILLLGQAPYGGRFPQEWTSEVETALKAGLSLVNGLHERLSSRAPFSKLKLAPNQWIWDIRMEPPGLGTASGKAQKLSSLRVLTVGTQMMVGKMSAAIELDRAARRNGYNSKFIASGQGGIMLGGSGVALDAVRVDYAASAVEELVCKYSKTHSLLFVEGQGSLLHPGSTAGLPLIRGSQPTHLILVHRHGDTHVNGLSTVPIPPLREVIKLHEEVARAGGAFSGAKVSGIALNTGHLSSTEAVQAILSTEDETGLPCDDVVRFEADKLLGSVIEPLRLAVGDFM